MGGRRSKKKELHPPSLPPPRSPKEKEKTMKPHPPPQRSPIIRTIKGRK